MTLAYWQSTTVRGNQEYVSISLIHSPCTFVHSYICPTPCNCSEGCLRKWTSFLGPPCVSYTLSKLYILEQTPLACLYLLVWFPFNPSLCSFRQLPPRLRSSPALDNSIYFYTALFNFVDVIFFYIFVYFCLVLLTRLCYLGGQHFGSQSSPRPRDLLSKVTFEGEIFRRSQCKCLIYLARKQLVYPHIKACSLDCSREKQKVSLLAC